MVRHAVIVGAGPVGCLAALSLHKAGWDVTVYEARTDMRLPENKKLLVQRSINLAISSRGITALHAVNPHIATKFLASAIPMRGRMIHPLKGQAESQLYDQHGQCINSIDRALLNEDLLDELSSAEIRVNFRHKLLAADFEHKLLIFQDANTSKDVKVGFDLCIGADGCYSAVRRQLMRMIKMDYQQEYIPHEYVELRVPPGIAPNGERYFQLDPGHLHIWPRHSFMLIALPNKDKSFTSTLFAPTEEFSKFKDTQSFLTWFKANFPDAIKLIGEERLSQDYNANPRSPLIHIKARPYHYKDSAIILGDAAHAMVPFYGQGLNCGLEDVRVLDVLLRKHNVDPVQEFSPGKIDDRLARALEEYSATRHDDLTAIGDLAMANYVEMRHSVTTPLYRLRKVLDGMLARWTPFIPFEAFIPQLTNRTFNPAPWGWLALYTMVTFRPDISYGEVLRKAERQNRVINRSMWSVAFASFSAGTFAFGWWAWRRR